MACDLPKGYRLGPSFLVLCFALTTSLALPHHGRDHHSGEHYEATRPNCPTGNLWFKNDGQCYERGIQGPCGSNMIIAEHPKHQRQGRCVCLKVVNCQYWPFAHFEEQNACFPLYDRGPCQESEWLVPMHHRKHGLKEIRQKQQQREDFIKAKCFPRECPPYNEQYQWFSAGGECYQVGTQGFCENSAERMYFDKGYSRPQCSINLIQVQTCGANQGGGYGGAAGGYGNQGLQAPGYGYQGAAPGYGGQAAQPIIPDYSVAAPGYGSQNPTPGSPGYGSQPSIPDNGGYGVQGSAPGYGTPQLEPVYSVPPPGYGGQGSASSGYGGSQDSYATIQAQPIRSLPVLEAAPVGYGSSATPSPLPILEPAPPSYGYVSSPTESVIYANETRGIGKGISLACPTGQVRTSSGSCAIAAVF